LKQLTGYWEPIKVGTNRAFGELGVQGTLIAPPEGLSDNDSAAAQLQIVHDERTQGGYKGFGLAPNQDILTDDINAAVDAGIPVVTIDSDLPNSKRQIYVGTLNTEAGQTGAQTLAAMLPAAPGTIIILGHDATDWPDGYNRTMGAKTVLDGLGYTTIIRKSTWTTDGGQMDADAMTAMIQTADPPVVGMLGVFSNAFHCAEAAAAAGKAAGDIKIAAFDFDPQTLANMQSGMIQATHVQRQYYMGYLLPYVLYSINALGLDKTKEILAPHMVDAYRFNTGLDVVGASQVTDYNNFLDALGISGG
jgi:ribose transport system substrate-binding protein